MPRPSLILVHGAATGAWVWQEWRRHLTPLGWEVNVLDLRGHGRSLPTDLGSVTMEDYLADLDSVTSQVQAARRAHPVVGGWGMGGLLALMHASKHAETPAVLLFSPDMPVEIAGRAPIEVQRAFAGAVLTPLAFGIDPDSPTLPQPALADLTEEEGARFLAQSAGAKESGPALRQRLRGISVAPGSVTCPALVVYGQQELEPRPSQCRELASLLQAESICVPGAGHRGIVCSDALVSLAAPEVDAWLRNHV